LRASDVIRNHFSNLSWNNKHISNNTCLHAIFISDGKTHRGVIGDPTGTARWKSRYEYIKKKILVA